MVNAIATKKGSTLGIALKTTVILEVQEGEGLSITSENKTISSRLITKTVQRAVLRNKLDNNHIHLDIKSNIPTGYGLKSSSSISSAVSMACHKAFDKKTTDEKILNDGVLASKDAKVSITGGFDDACGCYYGGFVATDNARMITTKREKCKNDFAVILIPKTRRKNPKKLVQVRPALRQAWSLANKGDWYNAMILNGLAVSGILGVESNIITELLQAGALGASISGNGPSVAAISKKSSIPKIKKIFQRYEGRILVSALNNTKARAYEL
ncbi:MAG: shikimate kinase [Candidatus Nitrosoabyssus spongiisocia]|nr:MAG: shikimate kinase [Nitrosopumilaceae archaeon AB1(1)]